MPKANADLDDVKPIVAGGDVTQRARSGSVIRKSSLNLEPQQKVSPASQAQDSCSSRKSSRQSIRQTSEAVRGSDGLLVTRPSTYSASAAMDGEGGSGARSTRRSSGSTFGEEDSEDNTGGSTYTGTVNSKANPTKSSALSRRLAKATDWYDGYKTRTSGYGPPYHDEYGGDLPTDCNTMLPDLKELNELLRNGANPNVGLLRDHGLTPMHFAARYGNLDLLKMLRRAGGNPAITNHLGLTPLSYACVFKLSMELEGGGDWEDRQVSVVRWLLEHGADPNHVDKAGYTPLAWACRSGVFPTVEALVEAGADVMHRRPTLPGGSRVHLPKVDPLAVTVDNRIRRYVQGKIEIILQREQASFRHNEKQDDRLQRLKAIQAAIARKQEARQFILQQKQRVKREEELSFEFMKIDKAEEARKARRQWLGRLKVLPGVWTKRRAAGGHDLESKPPSPTTPGAKDRARPRWVFDTQAASTKQEANAFDVLEQARQVEAFILNGARKDKILAPRWRATTGKQLLRLEHGQRFGRVIKGRRPRPTHGNMEGGGIRGGDDDDRLSGLEEEGSDSSSSPDSEEYTR